MAISSACSRNLVARPLNTDSLVVFSHCTSSVMSWNRRLRLAAMVALMWLGSFCPAYYSSYSYFAEGAFTSCANSTARAAAPSTDATC